MTCNGTEDLQVFETHAGVFPRNRWAMFVLSVQSKPSDPPNPKAAHLNCAEELFILPAATPHVAGAFGS